MGIPLLGKWLQRIVPFRRPPILALRVEEVLDNFATDVPPLQVDIPPFPPTALSAELSAFTAEICEANFALDPTSLENVSLFFPLESLVIEELPFEVFETFPLILDLFSGLTLPGCGGKAYQDDTDTLVEEHDAEDAPQRGPTVSQRDKRGVSGGALARTLDVFDLLLPYLQPPIETLLARAELFPPDRRPYDYQIQGIQFLVNHASALLGDEMGLGKTIQTIIAIQVLFRRGDIFRVLVLCRRSLLGTWEREFHNWAPELYLLKVRGNRDERKWLWQSPSAIYLTTYDTARQDISRGSGKINLLPKFDVVVLDEAQEIKNPRAKKSRAVRKIDGRYRWGLSGTPVENKPEDVISIFHYLKPGLFRGTEVYEPYEVKQTIEPFFLRRRVADVLSDLPEKVSREVWLDLIPEQREAYDRIYALAKDQLSRPGATRVHIFQRINELRQICNLDPGTGKSCKLEYLQDRLDIIVTNEQKALVFSIFPNITLRKILPSLEQFSPAIFDGTLNDRERDYLIQAFQQDTTPYVLLMSTKSGNVGLTLTRANHVFHFDHWWNPAVSRQAEARAYRIGQSRSVFIYDIFTRDTVEERIYEILKDKQQLFDRIIDDLSADYVQGAFTDEELFGLFELKPPKPS